MFVVEDHPKDHTEIQLAGCFHCLLYLQGFPCQLKAALNSHGPCSDVVRVLGRVKNSLPPLFSISNCFYFHSGMWVLSFSFSWTLGSRFWIFCLGQWWMDAAMSSKRSSFWQQMLEVYRSKHVNYRSKYAKQCSIEFFIKTIRFLFQF